MASRGKIVIIVLAILCAVILPFPLLAAGIRLDYGPHRGSMTNFLPGIGLCLGAIVMACLPRSGKWKFALVMVYLIGMCMGLFIFGAEFVCSQYQSCM